MIGAEHRAVGAHRGRVVEVPAGVDKADDGGAAPRSGRQLGHRRFGVSDKPRPEHQVLRRVAGDGQLREGDQVAPGLLGSTVRVDDPTQVAVEITDGGVELSQPHTKVQHAFRLRPRESV